MTFKPATWPRKLRSQEWFGGTGRDAIYHRGWLKNQGYPNDLFDGRPVIGIMNTWSELTPCNGHLRELAEKVKAGVWEAGGFPVEVPAFSASENTFRPTAMMFRNLAALSIEEQMRGQPIDGAVLLVGCDKTTPSLLMAAASCNLPSIVVTGGPMLNGYFPSDGHLVAPRDKSVYSLERRHDSLQDVVIDFGYPEDPWISDIHRQRVARFWTLYAQLQGAVLHRFTGDLATVFDSLTVSPHDQATPRTSCELDSDSTKPEMIRITRDIGMADWITSDVPRNLGIRPPSIQRGPMKIGIRWTENIDLDLYAKPDRNRETLFFQNTESADGYYFKDHRSSPQNEYEYIEFEEPVDIWNMKASVNFYEGQTPSPGPSGEIRIEFDNHTYVGRFTITQTHGNHGGTEQSAYWASIDVPKILKLR